MQYFSPEDRYHLRKAQMDADKKALEAQRVQQELERLVLELEYKYGLLTTSQTIDPKAAVIEKSLPAHKANGREPTLVLESTIAPEAAG